MQARRRSQQGLTLVEMIIALFVIAIAMLQAFEVIAQSSYLKQNAREFTLAREAATNQLELIKAYPQNSNFAGIATLNNTTFTVPGLNSGVGTITVNSANSNLYDVSVTVTWKGVKSQQTYTTSVMIVRS